MQIFEYQPAKLHSKLLVIDDIVHIGSSNFDFRSLYINMEIMLRIDDPAFAQTMRAISNTSSCHALQITAGVHEKRATLLQPPQVGGSPGSWWQRSTTPSPGG